MYRSRRVPIRLLVAILLLGAAVLAVYFFLTGRKKLLSPLPEAPAFEVIFYTPTPEPESISTPSATPKTTPKPTQPAKPKPSVTLAPLFTPSIKPTS